MTRDEAVRAIVDAVVIEGPQPALHRRTLRRHRRQWPTLWKAIDALVAHERGEAMRRHPSSYFPRALP